jgi:hypothetical protein
VAQATAIAATIGRLAGTDGGAGRDYARSCMLMAEAEDLYNAMQKGNATIMVALGERGKGGEDANVELWGTTLPRHMACMEKMLGDSAAFTESGETVGAARNQPARAHSLRSLTGHLLIEPINRLLELID